MNRKNPGLAEIEPVSRDEQILLHRCYALGSTIAAIIYTAYEVWRKDLHHEGTAVFGWLLTAWVWGVYWYEARKRNRNRDADQTEA